MAEHQYLAEGQDVVYVGPEKKNHKAKILTVYGPDSARLEWENGVAIADYSDKKEAGTFHFGEASTKGEEKK